MKSARFMNIVARFSLAFALVNYVFSEAKNMQLNAGAYLMIISMTFLCAAFLKDKKVLRLLCIIAEFVPIIFAKSIIEVFILISAIAYSIYYIVKESSELRYGEYFDEFKKLVVAALAIIVIGLADSKTFMNSCLIYLFIFFITSILLLRVLRNMEFSKDNEQIHKLNILYGISVFVITFILRIDIVRNGILKAFEAVYFVIAEAISALAFVLGAIFITIGKFIFFAIIKILGLHIKSYKQQSQGSDPTAQFVVFPNKKTIFQGLLENPVISIIVKVLLIVALVYIFIRLFKARKSNINETEDYIEEKEYIKDADKPKRSIWSRFKPKSYSEQIRYMYYKLMKLSIKKSVDIKNSDTTLDINKKSQSVFEKSVLDQIREIYIKIRYSDISADKEAVSKMSDSFNKIK